MKKLNLLIVAIALFVTACDYNDVNFPGLDDMNKPTDLKMVEYTLADADYGTIASNAANRALADSKGVRPELNALTTAKAFSITLPAADYVPAFLASKYPTADTKSAVRLTYNFKTGSTGFYKLSADDYTQIWGGVSTVGALSPSKSPNDTIPALMARKYPAAKEGDVKIVEYEYSTVNPGQNETEIPVLVENFTSFDKNGTDVYFSAQTDAKGWKGAATGEGALQPDIRAFSGNTYVQFSAHRSAAGFPVGVVQEMWAISPRLTIPADKKTILTFETSGAYFNPSSIFEVYELDSDDPATANKTKLEGWRIATIDDSPSPYTPFIPSGDIILSSNVKYLGFRYYGISGSGNSTTYQLDNINVSYIDVSIVVPAKETRFAYAKYSNGAWALDNAKNIYTLTAADYTAMGKTGGTLAAVDAPNYLPVFLQQKYPYAQQGDVRVIVYKTSATANNADEYVYKNGVWAPVSFTETRTEQFIKGDKGKWVFDPTVRYTMVKADYQLMCTYVLNHPVLNVYKRGTYTNEEWYYGFNAYYDNIGFRISGSATSSRDVPCSKEFDTELHSLSTDAEKLDLLWKRLEEDGMIVFLQLKYPNAVAEVSGIQVFYHITAKVFFGPTTNDTKMYTFSYETLTSGIPATPDTPATPPTFKFLNREELK